MSQVDRVTIVYNKYIYNIKGIKENLIIPGTGVNQDKCFLARKSWSIFDFCNLIIVFDGILQKLTSMHPLLYT